MKKFTFLLAAVLCAAMSFATNYVKVTSAPTDWSGEYILVYENSATEAYVWTGVDAANCYTSATIADNKISGDDFVTITIASMTGGYSIVVNGGDNNGKYLGYTGGKNGMTFDTKAILNTISYESNATAIKSGTTPSTMRFNKASDNMRFRYYKTGLQAVQLYKKEVLATGISLNKTTLSLDKGATEQLTATLTPEGATTEIVWKVDNDWVATVANGLVTAVGVGDAHIYAEVTPEEGTTYTASCHVYVTAAPDAPTFTVTDEVFEGSMNVALAAAEGMKIYYTTNGDVPTTTSTEYTAPFEITATTTVKAIAYDEANTKASVVAEKTYTKAMTCAEANAAADKAVINLNTVTVVYVNGTNIYVADATGGALVYKYEYGLKAGQVVKGLKGSMKIYNNLPEIEPSVKVSALTITEGTVPEPTVITAVPTMDNINQYVRINGVATSAAATWKSSDKDATDRTLVAKLGSNDITLYNTFKIDKTFAKGDYNIVGFVTCYKTTIQIAVVSATAVYSIMTDVNDKTMGTVSGEGDYEEGTKVTLTAKANDGYVFVGWKDYVSEDTVSTDATYTFTATEDALFKALFKKNTFSVEAVVNDENMGTIDGIPTAKVASGTEITLTAKPATGYEFVNWTDLEDKVVSTDAAYTFTVTEEVALIANFKEIKAATWYGQEPLTGTLSGVNYSIVYEITRNITKTLTFKLAMNDEAAAVENLKITVVINNAEVGYITENFTSGEFTTSGYYTDGTELNIQFYLGCNGDGKFTNTIKYTVGSSNDKPTAIDAVSTHAKATKRIENGVLIIEKNGIRYNAQGVVVE